MSAVLRLIYRSAKLRWLCGAYLVLGSAPPRALLRYPAWAPSHPQRFTIWPASRYQYSFISGSVNADVIVPSLGVEYIGYTNAFMTVFEAIGDSVIRTATAAASIN